MNYNVYYLKHKNLGEFENLARDLMFDFHEGSITSITKQQFNNIYVLVNSFHSDDIKSLEEIYNDMQSENWSPLGEKRSMIKELGLSHTSMSIGDIIEKIETQKFWIVTTFGFKEVKIESDEDKYKKAIHNEIDIYRKALQDIIDQCPNPKLPYGIEVIRIAKKALGQN
jgi:hypothetical protein